MSKIAVITCVWKRIEDRLEKTLKMLSFQSNKDFDIFIWNNNFDASSEVVNICKKFPELNISIKSSYKNYGGFGRFYYAKEIKDKYKNILFIDDDIDFDSKTIQTCYDNIEKNIVKSWWSWKINGKDYWDRERILNLNEEADYCGTGMMLIESEVFSNDNIFDLINPRYWYIEDLWLTFFCKYILKFSCKFLPVNATIMEDNKNQSDLFEYCSVDRKKEFYEYLLDKLYIK